MRKLFLCCICSVFLFTSCDQKEKLCKEAIKGFFKEVKNENPIGMKRWYPDVEELLSYYKSDTIIIKSVKKDTADQYIAEVNNIFTNGFGRRFDRDITLFLKPTEDNSGMFIYDSQGMLGLSDNKEYAYAKRHGAIKTEHNTDVKLSSAIRAAMYEPYMTSLRIKEELSNGSIVQGKVNWVKEYGIAKGNFIVKNTYNIKLHNLKYIVHFMTSSDGEEIAQDDGYVKIGDLQPGESTSESFFKSFVGNAGWAKVTFSIDEDDLWNAILEE